MKDIEGRELKVGDNVICTAYHDSSLLYKWKVVGFTPKAIKLEQVTNQAYTRKRLCFVPENDVYKIE